MTSLDLPATLGALRRNHSQLENGVKTTTEITTVNLWELL